MGAIIIINSTKDDIWDMDELFHKLTNFDALLAKKEEGTFTFLFLLHILLTGRIGHCSVL